MKVKSFKKTFFDFFPPPRSLMMPAVSLNLSDHSIKVISIKGGHKPSLDFFGSEEIPDGVIQSGNINDRSKLIEILRSVKKKYNITFVRVSLPEEKAYVFKVRLPKVQSEKELRGSIEFVLEDNVPISLNEAVFDYSIIPNSEKKQGIEVGVYVLPQKIIGSYIGIFNDVGIIPLSFEIEAESIARAVIEEGDLSTYMIVDYGRTRTGFSVVSKGVVRYTSTADIGGDPIARIFEGAGISSREDVERFKNENGLIKDPEHPNLYMSLVNVVSVLRDEINKRYIYWHTHKDESGIVGEHISKIILVGGNSNLLGLDEYLSSSLKVRVERANVWTNITFDKDFVPPINFNQSLGYASAIGLALRDLKN